jgi:hypothetical protein
MYQTFPDCTTPSHEGWLLGEPNLAIFKVDALVDHRHLTHTIHTIIFETIRVSNRDQCTASVCGNLHNLTGIPLAVILLTIETETNLDASELGHFFLSWVLSISALYTPHFRVQVRIVLGKRFFVRANIMPNIFYRVWHRICSACHFGRNRGLSAILAVNPPYGGEFVVSLP